MNMLQNVLLICTLLFISSCSKNSTPTFLNDWDEDVYYFGENLKDNHVDLFFNISKSDFENDISTLRKNTSTYSDQKILIELSKIISKIGDSHTQLEFTHKLTALPFNILWMDDGLILSEVDNDHAQLLGKRITEINGIPILEVVDQFRAVITYENESSFKNQAVNYLRFAEFYQDFEISDPVEDISLTLDDGSKAVLKPSSNKTSTLDISATPLFLNDTETYYWFEEIPDKHILYIQYNSCRERMELSFESFTNQIVNKIDTNNEIEKVIIDLRHNGGGNSTIAKPLIDALEKYIAQNRFTKNQIYLIVGRKTFSSAILNTIEIKNKLDIVVLGEPTGGKPNHHGEVKSFRLPNSLLNVSYSTKYFTLSSKDDDSFYPDIFVAYTSDHLLEGKDPVFEWIIEN